MNQNYRYLIMNNSSEHFLNSLHERHNYLIDQYNKTINSLVSNKNEIKLQETKLFNDGCLNVMSIIADQDTPHWLRQLYSESSLYINKHQNAATWMFQLIEKGQ